MGKDNREAKTLWDEAIAETDRRIADASIHLAELKQALRVFKRRRDEGAAWPSSKEASSKATSPHQSV